MATDPICGMTVDEASAPRAERNGQMFYFCSEHCRQKFLMETASHAQHKESHSERGHGQAHELRRGAAEPSTAFPQPQKYTCPMHPEVISDKAGECPKCGMALEPVVPKA